MLKNLYSRARQIFYHFFENELIRRVVKNTGYLFSATGISAALSMLQGILVARMLGVTAFGVLGTIIMFTSVVNKFASFRMNELVVKYVGQYTESDDPKHAAAVFKAASLVELLASVFAFILIRLLAPLAAQYFGKDPATVDWFVIYGWIVLANLIAESSTGLLQIYNRFRFMAVLNILQSVFTLTVIVVVYVTQGGVMGVLLAYMGGKVIGAVGLTAAALVEATRRWDWGWWRTPISLLRSNARELTRFAVSTYISASLSLVTKDSELLWVSLLRNPTETGYYKLALALANLVQMPISPMPQATYPELSREVARKNWSNVRYVLRQGSILAGSYTLVVSLVLAFLGPLIIQYIYAPEFLPAYPALLILLVGFLVANTFYWNRIALLAIGLPEFPAKVNLILAVIKITGIFLLVPIYGYLASAALLAGSYIIGVSVSVLKFFSELSRQERSMASKVAQVNVDKQ
ncbi:MAG: flippase [Anaerolineales bacterium]|nr:flippase [Anaerolineales bacterium]